MLHASLPYILLEILRMISMEAASQPKLTVDEFFEAISGADERYELIDGVAYAMAGAKEGHNVICSNVLVASRRVHNCGTLGHPGGWCVYPARR